MEIPGLHTKTWLVATNYKKPLIFIPRWLGSRQLEAMVREVGQPNGKDCGIKGIPASAYPTTIYWKPHRMREEDELSDLDDLNSPLQSPLPPDDPSVSHRRTISEVTARPEREQEDIKEHPARRQAIGQEDGEQPARAIGKEGGEQEPRERLARASGRASSGPATVWMMRCSLACFDNPVSNHILPARRPRQEPNQAIDDVKNAAPGYVITLVVDTNLFCRHGGGEAIGDGEAAPGHVITLVVDTLSDIIYLQVNRRSD